MSASRFEGRVAIVTGGASGIGLATVDRMSLEGAGVVLADRDVAGAERARERLSEKARVVVVPCDVSREEDVQRTVRAAMERFGRLDVVVNNAGLMIFKPLVEHQADDWTRVLSVDLLGAFFFTKHAFEVMKSGSTIVNVASVHAVETTPNVASYAAAKAALVSLTHSTNIEGAARGIRANAVLPGAIDTPMLWNNPNVKAGLEQIQKSQVGSPEDVAALITYLASDDSAFVCGAAVRVDGGRLSRL